MPPKELGALELVIRSYPRARDRFGALSERICLATVAGFGWGWVRRFQLTIQACPFRQLNSPPEVTGLDAMEQPPAPQRLLLALGSESMVGWRQAGLKASNSGMPDGHIATLREICLTSGSGASDRDRDGVIRLDEWLAFAVDRLPQPSEDIERANFRGIRFSDRKQQSRPARVQRPSLFDFNAAPSSTILHSGLSNTASSDWWRPTSAEFESHVGRETSLLNRMFPVDRALRSPDRGSTVRRPICSRYSMSDGHDPLLPDYHPVAPFQLQDQLMGEEPVLRGPYRPRASIR